MPDEAVGVSSEPQVEVEPEPQDGPAPDSGVEAAEESEPGPIPYSRFKEVNEQRHAEAQARQSAEARANQLLGQLQQAQVAMTQRQATPQPESQDPDLALARSKFGNDEVGQQTFDAVASVVKAITKGGAASSLSEEKVWQIATQAAGGVKQELNSGMALTNGMNRIVAENNLTQKEAQAFHAALGRQMQDPQFAQSARIPQNVKWILDGTLMDLARDGAVKLGRQPRAQQGSVLQPGGNGVGRGEPIEILPANSPFETERGMTAERAAELDAMSAANAKAAMR